ncbi:MAG: adenylyltransferase/cytidyltransferase family protein [Verrucomicrobiae bacterium]|nr:adenylyltransferase/cytidyltransferase family protein [Verrucomicrobiae bacterium]
MTAPANLLSKIITIEKLQEWRNTIRQQNRLLVVTNGCFDILHAGHVVYLSIARELGDCLLVGVNSDSSVRALKGPNRPVNHQDDRALVLAALAAVDAVCIFNEINALNFLKLAQPDIYVKGGDYTLDTINQEERRLVENLGGQVKVLPGLPCRSTSALIAKISS